MLSALCRTAKRSTCKAAPPLPKNLAALRFSGALFFEPRSRMGLARCVSENKRSYFHAFTLFKGEGGPHIQGSQKVSKNFLGRGAAGATGKAANAVRRLSWRLASDEDEGCTLLVASVSIKTRIVSPHQALRASFPLRGKPCIEPCSEQLSVLYKIPRLRSG